jgi:hypothetical protein
MDELVIPEAPDFLDTGLSVKDAIIRYATNAKTDLDAKVAVLTDEKNKDVQKYIDIIMAVYSAFSEVISKAIETKSDIRFSCRVSPTGYPDRWVKPSIELWKKCNPGGYQAITILMDRLVRAGWKPVYQISQVELDRDDGMFSGGDYWIVSCANPLK